jgi:splicing factor 3B subunit 1
MVHCRPLTDEDLDNMLPGPADGYKVLAEPPGYEPIRTPARKLMATPTPFGGTPLYQIPEEDR